jgi:hypothetical protein
LSYSSLASYLNVAEAKCPPFDCFAIYGIEQLVSSNRCCSNTFSELAKPGVEIYLYDFV